MPTFLWGLLGVTLVAVLIILLFTEFWKDDEPLPPPVKKEEPWIDKYFRGEFDPVEVENLEDCKDCKDEIEEKTVKNGEPHPKSKPIRKFLL